MAAYANLEFRLGCPHSWRTDTLGDWEAAWTSQTAFAESTVH